MVTGVDYINTAVQVVKLETVALKSTSFFNLKNRTG